MSILEGNSMLLVLRIRVINILLSYLYYKRQEMCMSACAWHDEVYMKPLFWIMSYAFSSQCLPIYIQASFPQQGTYSLTSIFLSADEWHCGSRYSAFTEPYDISFTRTSYLQQSTYCLTSTLFIISWLFWQVLLFFSLNHLMLGNLM